MAEGENITQSPAGAGKGQSELQLWVASKACSSFRTFVTFPLPVAPPDSYGSDRGRGVGRKQHVRRLHLLREVHRKAGPVCQLSASPVRNVELFRPSRGNVPGLLVVQSSAGAIVRVRRPPSPKEMTMAHAVSTSI